MSSPPSAPHDVVSALDGERWTLDEFVGLVAGAPPPAQPFAPDSVAFCEALSRDLLDPRMEPRHAQVAALGYWMRPASITRARAAFFRLEDERTILVPRGRVLHVTPANVDTMFAYSWILALLAGNSNVVRITSRGTPASRRVLDAVARQIGAAEFVDLRRRNQLIVTDHDDRVSRTLSLMADVRVLWGGDATIEHFRAFALPPRGRDVVFPNRHSLAILDAAAVRAADPDSLARLAGRFFNDAYWFDQAACSSPRLLVWVAAPGDDVTDVRLRFRAAVAEAIRRHAYTAETGAALAKISFALQTAAAIDGVRFTRDSNEATWVELPGLAGYSREHCGGGLFFEVVTHDLGALLASFAGPADQTAACFGFDREQLRMLARKLNGRGIDRWVPIGEALTFDRSWDGYDLLGEFARRVVVDP